MTTPAPTTTETPQVLTSAEVSERTGWALSTICRWAKNGDLPVIRKMDGRTGSYIFDRSVLDLIRSKNATDTTT